MTFRLWRCFLIQTTPCHIFWFDAISFVASGEISVKGDILKTKVNLRGLRHPSRQCDTSIDNVQGGEGWAFLPMFTYKYEVSQNKLRIKLQRRQIPPTHPEVSVDGRYFKQ